MRRTHIMHTRDNRRPHYFAQRDHTDRRPALRWEQEGDTWWMSIDTDRVAEVRKVGDPCWDPWGNIVAQRHDSILRAGPDALTRKAFDDLASAKAYCEGYFARRLNADGGAA